MRNDGDELKPIRQSVSSGRDSTTTRNKKGLGRARSRRVRSSPSIIALFCELLCTSRTPSEASADPTASRSSSSSRGLFLSYVCDRTIFASKDGLESWHPRNGFWQRPKRQAYQDRWGAKAVQLSTEKQMVRMRSHALKWWVLV